MLDGEDESNRRSFSWAGSTSSEDHNVPYYPAQRDSIPNNSIQTPERAISPASSQESNPFLTPTRTTADHVVGDIQLDGGYEAAAHHAQTVQSNDVAYDDSHAQPERPFEADRKSQVIRKINSGFEILRPGTLDQPRRSNDTAALQEIPDNGNKRQSKKLQRKRRSSGASYSVGTRSIVGAPRSGRP